MNTLRLLVAGALAGALLYGCQPTEVGLDENELAVESTMSTTAARVVTPTVSGPQLRRIGKPLVVPVYLHIFKPGKSSTPSASDIATAKQILLDDFLPHGIEICFAETKYHNATLDILGSAQATYVEGYLNLCLGDASISGGGLAGGANSTTQGIYEYATLGGSTLGVYRLHDQTISHETGHCFNLPHVSNASNIMYNGVNFNNTFTAQQVEMMKEAIKTSYVHNRWHQYLNVPSGFYIGQNATASFNFSSPNSDYSSLIQVVQWEVSPNLKKVSTAGNTLTFAAKTGCLGSGWINATLQVGPCEEISICKQVQLRRNYHPGGPPLQIENYVNYTCGSYEATCQIYDPYGACSTCPLAP